MEHKHCKVAYCRFPHRSHTTRDHKCGSCGELGHGQTECGNHRKIERLKQYYNEILDDKDWCTDPFCVSQQTHTNIAHTIHHTKCEYCDKVHKTPEECIIMTIDQATQRFNYDMNQNIDYNNFFTPFSNSYAQIFLGQGCLLYIRKKDNELLTCFLHGDNMGQYGIDDTPIVERFIDGLHDVTNILNNYINGTDVDDLNIECPLCRTENPHSSIININGSEDNCSICYENKVQKFFPKCGHACVCNSCFTQLVNHA